MAGPGRAGLRAAVTVRPPWGDAGLRREGSRGVVCAMSSAAVQHWTGHDAGLGDEARASELPDFTTVAKAVV
jgi:hypothetical protein